MVLFYNIVGFLACLLAVFTYRLGYGVGEQQKVIKTVVRLLSGAYLLSGLSLVVAQWEPRLAQDQFDILNPLTLLFFYLISHLFLYIIMLLYEATERVLDRFIRSVWVVSGLFGLYTLGYFTIGDAWVYSFEEVLATSRHSVVFVFRLGLFAVIVCSMFYHSYQCYQAGRLYTQHAADSFSQTEMQRSVIVSKLMWNLKALAVWILMTYCYTTPILEVISSLLMVVVFALQYWGFRGYLHRRNHFWFNMLTVSSEVNFEIDPFEDQLQQRLKVWAKRSDKPFTHSGLTIGPVAREIGVSKNKLSEHLNKHHTHFRPWINNLRIEEARHILADQREQTLTEVAEAVGFCDLPAFSRAFKKAVGVSPRAFRNEITSLPAEPIQAQ